MNSDNTTPDNTYNTADTTVQQEEPILKRPDAPKVAPQEVDAMKNQQFDQQSDNYGQEDWRPHLHDGYRDTEGSGYNPDQTEAAQQAETGYDPTQSGAQPAQNEPGKRVDVPGRETGTAWGEQQQMGYTTDTPDRGNPAN